LRKIELKDIRNIAEYEKVRESMRAEIIARCDLGTGN